MGPFSGTSWEYKCHPESISAVAIKSYSVSDIFSKEAVHFTGSNNWELGLKLLDRKLKTSASSLGGKHLESSQTIYSTDPCMVSGLLLNFTRCLKTALPSKYLIRIMKTGSSTSCFSSSIVSPTNIYVSELSKVNVVGIGPSSGTFWEYKCHPDSMVAVTTKSYSVSDIFSTELVHSIGSKICENPLSPKTKKASNR